MATKLSSVKKKAAARKAESPEALIVPDSPWTIKACMAVLGAKGAAVWNVVASLGPRALSLWPAASKNLLNHQMGKDAIAGWRNALDRENADYAEVEKKLIAKIPSAKFEEYIEIQQKIEFLRGLRCQGNVVVKALTHLAAKPESTPTMAAPQAEPPNSQKQDAVVSDHWTDHFNRFARQRNEPWREQLLARALAAEAEMPGSISSRLLWVLGTLEADKFKCMAALLDLSSTINGNPVIPGENMHANRESIPADVQCYPRISALVPALAELGLVVPEGVVRTFSEGQKFSASYGEESCIVACNTTFTISGVLFTNMGNALARLYDQQPNEVGRKFFREWIQRTRGA